MNRFQFIGNLCRDAEIRTIEGGSQAIAFTVGVTEKWKDRNGEQKENTTWVSCTRWVSPGGSTAIANYLKKGQKVLVEGKPTARCYTKQDGSSAAALEVRVEHIELLGGAPQAHPQAQTQQRQQQQQWQPAPASSFEVNDDLSDLPF